MAVEGGARVLKYLLFIFTFLFFLAGLALMIIPILVTGKLIPSTVAGVYFNGVEGFFVIIYFTANSVIIVTCYCGCHGACLESHVNLVVFIVSTVFNLLMLSVAVITVIAAFVMRNQVTGWITDGFTGMIMEYKNPQKQSITYLWNSIQKDLKCCGSQHYTDWLNNDYLRNTSSTPNSCCKTYSVSCGNGTATLSASDLLYKDGCAEKVSESVFRNLFYVGVTAVATGFLMLIGIILASCLAVVIRKDNGSVSNIESNLKDSNRPKPTSSLVKG